MKNTILVIAIIASFMLFIIGDSNNEPLETQNNGGTMCMACIGLE